MEADSNNTEVTRPYRGRFAPTPSGPLHFGSLVAAVGSYLEARQNAGDWLVRMEDLDTPRVIPGAADAILRTLEAFGFEWQGAVMWQSRRTEAYRDAFTRLERKGHVYPCGCSRAVQEGSGCAAKCSGGIVPGTVIRSWRTRVPPEAICWNDWLHGEQCTSPARDFVVLRGDGIFAYQLAVVVDDAAQEISEVVRGADLLGTTACQICLQRWLNFRQLTYLHLPIARTDEGEKLSKQTHAPAIDQNGDARQLRDALRFLGQLIPLDLQSIPEIWEWAFQEWRPELIPH